MNPRRTIAVLSPTHGGSYFGAVLAGLRTSAVARGARVVAIQTLDARREYAHTGESDFITPVAWDHVDALVVIINAVSPEYLQAARAAGKPVVMISREVDGFDCPVVMPDNRSGARAAVEHLMAHGHDRIGFAGSLAQSDIRERYEAYCDVLREHGLDPKSAPFLDTIDNTEAGCRPTAEALAASGLDMTAMFVATDQNAVAFLSVLADAGYELPRDLAIVGFDNVALCADTSPTLSSISQNLNGIGVRAATFALDLLDGIDVPNGRHLVPASFVARDSCGCSALPAIDTTQVDGVDTADGRHERLVFSLRASLPETSDETAEVIADAARVLCDVFEAAAIGPIPSPAPGLSRAVEVLHETSHGRGSFVAITGCLLVLIRDLLAGPAGDDPTAAYRLDACVVEATLAAHEAHVREKHLANRVLRTSLRDEYDLSRDLLRNGSPYSLEWLARMRVKAGCVALWSLQNPEETPKLCIAGSFDPDQAAGMWVGSKYAVESFPPARWFDLADDTNADVIFVLPLRTEDTEWGMFCVIGPVECQSPTGRESYYQWAALLSVALDHDRNLESLRGQREDLAAAYGRERRLVESIRVSEQRYALAARAANDGLWDWDLASGEIYYSTRWKEMLGYSDDEVGTGSQEWLGRVHPEDQQELGDRLHGNAEVFEHEHRVRARDGAYRWMHCRALAVAEGGVIRRLVGSLTDVTERKELEERLRRGALYDGLTGLPNRVLFVDRLAGSIAHHTRYPQNDFAVLFLDLDGFKDVNDSLGHAAGDSLLARVAERVKAQLRATDTAARIGGDEFAVLLTDLSDLAMVPMIVGRIHDALAVPHEIEGYRMVVTASIGIATSEVACASPEEMLKHADLAMYGAKTSKRGTSATYDVSMSSNAVARLQIAHAGLSRSP